MQVIRLAGRRPELFRTDAEVLQELFHRFRTSDSWALNRARVETFASLMQGRVAQLTDADVLQAVALAERYPRLSARDLVHLAVMTRLGVNAIVSTDGDFDAVPELRRLDPRSLGVWEGEFL